MSVTFHVDGTPTAQGSVRAYNNHIVHTNAAELRSWRQDIAARARDASVTPLDGPVGIIVDYLLPRPSSVSVKRRPLPTVKPDLDKLIRATLDALTGIAYSDDAQVVHIAAAKRYANPPEPTGLCLTIWSPAEPVEKTP